jgi:AcrR family transcriptional regulator
VHPLSERGYDAMTLDQVAEAAGMAKAVLYKHFKGKEDLCGECHGAGLERAQGFLDGLPARMVASQRLQALCAGCCRPS